MYSSKAERLLATQLKVAIVYRVIQHWRAPVFARISQQNGVDLTVLHGEDFSGTKIVSFQGALGFNAVKLKSINMKMGTSNGAAYVPLPLGLWGELKRLKPNVIVSEGASNLFSNLICFAYSKIHGVPLIQWGLGEIEGRKRSIHRRLVDVVFRFVERNSAGAIAYSSFGASYYRKIGLPDNRVFTAVNVVDTEKRIRDLKSYCEENELVYPSPLPAVFNILFVGALAENKGVDTLIRAFATSQATIGKSARLTIIGDGPFRSDLQKLANELGVGERVFMPGQVTDGIARYFYEASLFVLPGLGGLAVSDALSHGVPVVATVGDGCEKDLIQNGVNGYYVPEMSLDILVGLISDLYNDRDTLDSIRRGAQKFPEGDFSIENYVDSVVNAVRVVSND